MYLLIMCYKYMQNARYGRGTRWGSWLRHCATSRKFAGSISDGVFAIFHNHSGRTMALGLTQPLTEMSTRNISCGVKAADAQGWQPYHLHVPIVLKFGSLNLLEPSGPGQGCIGIPLPLLHGIDSFEIVGLCFKVSGCDIVRIYWSIDWVNCMCFRSDLTEYSKQRMTTNLGSWPLTSQYSAVRKSPPVMETEGSLPCSQKPVIASCPYS